MLKKWGLRSVIAIGAAFGLVLLFSFALQAPAVGQTIGSPAACGTCHVMTNEVVTLSASAHRSLACLDCHSAQGFFERPAEELKSASRHLSVFLLNTTPDVIKPKHESRLIAQANCVRCHADLLGDTKAADHKGSGRLCFDCHRETPHGTPLRN